MYTLGNAVKAGVRFVSYDYFKHLLADPEGKVSAPRSLAGNLESRTCPLCSAQVFYVQRVSGLA